MVLWSCRCRQVKMYYLIVWYIYFFFRRVKILWLQFWLLVFVLQEFFVFFLFCFWFISKGRWFLIVVFRSWCGWIVIFKGLKILVLRFYYLFRGYWRLKLGIFCFMWFSGSFLSLGGICFWSLVFFYFFQVLEMFFFYFWILFLIF